MASRKNSGLDWAYSWSSFLMGRYRESLAISFHSDILSYLVWFSYFDLVNSAHFPSRVRKECCNCLLVRFSLVVPWFGLPTWSSVLTDTSEQVFYVYDLIWNWFVEYIDSTVSLDRVNESTHDLNDAEGMELIPAEGGALGSSGG